MAISDVVTKGNIWTGVAVGAALLVAPVVIPAIAGAMRPLLKSAIKGGYMVYENIPETLAGVYEQVEDLVAEAITEVEAERVQVVESLPKIGK